jgi:hypothetical protein
LKCGPNYFEPNARKIGKTKACSYSITFDVPADLILTTRAGFALTSVRRVADMVIDGSAQTSGNGKFSNGSNTTAGQKWEFA